MNGQWLKKNNINPIKSMPAYLENFELKINMPCEHLGKGYASVSPKDGAMVYGIVHEVSSYELRILDILEWKPFNFYFRHKARIKTLSGESVEAWYYVAAAPKEDLKASPFYKDLLVNAATENNFPKDYIENLSGLPAGEDFELDHGF